MDMFLVLALIMYVVRITVTSRFPLAEPRTFMNCGQRCVIAHF